MTTTIDDFTAVLPTGDRRVGWEPTALLAPVAIAIAILGVAAAAKDEVVAADWVRLLLVVAWAIAGAATLRQQAQRRAGRLILVGALLGSVAFAAARYAGTSSGTAARSHATRQASRIDGRAAKPPC